MTLVNRVSTFFLLALAICLIGYSALMYSLIREHLFHQFDQQLSTALSVIAAAIEVEPDGVKWQPSDHAINLGNENEDAEVRWLIVDSEGIVVDASRNLQSPHQEVRQQLLQLAQAHGKANHESQSAGHWRWLQQRLTCPAPKPVEERDFDEFSQLLVIVGREADQLHADLWQLALLATVLPMLLWIFAALAGRSYCRRALRPVGNMADRARSMTNADFNLRLPVSNQQDELTSLAIAFNNLLDRLQQAYHQQQRFTGDAAHQLRTPLTILRGQLDVALRHPRDSEEYRELLALLREQTSDLQEIVETLLFLARTEGDAVPPDQQELSLKIWLPEYLNHWQSHPRSSDLQSQMESDAQLKISVSLLRQALDNLISNAFKYSPPGSPVLFHIQTAETNVIFTVQDAGLGVPEAERAAIFEPFYRTTQARQTGTAGTGLGLSIVARIAHILGGNIRCEPATPNGSRFVLTLPQNAGQMK